MDAVSSHASSGIFTEQAKLSGGLIFKRLKSPRMGLNYCNSNPRLEPSSVAT